MAAGVQGQAWQPVKRRLVMHPQRGPTMPMPGMQRKGDGQSQSRGRPGRRRALRRIARAPQRTCTSRAAKSHTRTLLSSETVTANLRQNAKGSSGGAADGRQAGTRAARAQRTTPLAPRDAVFQGSTAGPLGWPHLPALARDHGCVHRPGVPLQQAKHVPRLKAVCKRCAVPCTSSRMTRQGMP